MMATNLTDDQVRALLSKRSIGQPESLEDLEISFDDIDSFGNIETIKKMFGDIHRYQRMIKEKIVFVNNDLSEVIPFTRENLYLICAYTGNGKSTIAANISYPLWQQGKKVLVLSNEESDADVVLRIACLELGYNFNDYKKNLMPNEELARAMARCQDVARFIKVLDIGKKGKTGHSITTTLEYVQKVLDAVKDSDYSCVLIDYYQLIQYSVLDKSKKRYDVLNDLRIWLGQYVKESNMPVVLFAQLHSIGKRNNKQLDSRVKECPTILEPSTVVIEAIPNFEDSTTEFLIHKDRFGSGGKSITCGFQNGRYVNMSESFRDAIHKRNIRRSQANASKILPELMNTQTIFNGIPDSVLDEINAQLEKAVKEENDKH